MRCNARLEAFHFLFFQLSVVPHSGGGGRGTPLYGLNGDVQPDKVRFSEGFVLNGVSISSFFVLNRVSLHELM